MTGRATLPQVLVPDEDISITVCTLGSVYRAFLLRDENRGWELFRSYEMLIVNEASQSADCDLLPLFSCIFYSSRPYPDRWTRIVAIWVPLHMEPSVRLKRSSPYTSVKKCSFFERISLRSSPLLPGINAVPIVQLNLQYGMSNIITELSY